MCALLINPAAGVMFVTPWTIAHQAPLFMRFSRQECWSCLPFSSWEDLPEPGIKPKSPALAGRFFTAEPTVKPLVNPVGDGDQSLSCVQLFETPWTITCQAPLSTGFPKQEYMSGLPFPSPGDLPDPRIEPVSLASPELAGGFIPTSATLDTPS